MGPVDFDFVAILQPHKNGKKYSSHFADTTVPLLRLQNAPEISIFYLHILN